MSLIKATTLTRVKNVLGIAASVTTYDVTLTTMITGVSHEIENYIGRPLHVEARTEDYTIRLHGNSIWLRAYPVLTVTSIKVDPFWQWVSDAIDSDRYKVTTDTGQVFFLDELVGGWRVSGWDDESKDAIRVVYTGGIVSATASLASLAPALMLAADFQIAEDWRRRENPATERRGGPGGGTTWTDAHRFLPRVQQLLQPFRRLVHGLP